MKIKEYSKDAKTMSMTKKEHKLFEEYLTADGVIFETMTIDSHDNNMTIMYYMDHAAINIDEEFITFKLMNG